MVAEVSRICGSVRLHVMMTSYLGRAWWDFGATWMLLHGCMSNLFWGVTRLFTKITLQDLR